MYVSPQELGIEGFNKFAKQFQLQLHEVALKIFRAFALSLGWPEDYFEEVCVRVGGILVQGVVGNTNTPSCNQTHQPPHATNRTAPHNATPPKRQQQHPPLTKALPSTPPPTTPVSQPFDVTSEENPSFVAWNYYPPLQPEDLNKELPPRLHAHADMDVMTILFQQDSHVGLEIAPGKDIDNQDLIEDIGNIWNGVPRAREWFALVCCGVMVG